MRVLMCGQPDMNKHTCFVSRNLPRVLVVDACTVTDMTYSCEMRSAYRPPISDINANLDVEGLCRRLPERLQKQVDSNGERLKY